MFPAVTAWKLKIPKQIALSCLFLLAAASSSIYGIECGFKYFKNYTLIEYGLQPQNWCIIQDKQGLIYVGNQGGLLEYDGVSWRSIEVPNSSVRSMAADDDGILYIGGKNEIGFMVHNPGGTLQYKSLLGQLAKDEKNFGTVWKTQPAAGNIFFWSSKAIFRWDKKKLSLWQQDQHYNGIYTCAGKLFVNQKNAGLLRLEKNSLQLIPGGEAFANAKIVMIAPLDKQKLLIATSQKGFYSYDGFKTVPFPTGADDYLKKKQFYNGIRLSSGDFALAALQGGLVIIDGQGRLKQIFTRASGLQDDDVKYVCEDFQGNLWLGLNDGISKIEYASPFFIYDERAGLSGMVLTVTRSQTKLYVGTTSGLYAQDTSGKFTHVYGIPAYCWGLITIDTSILAATSKGVFQVKDNFSEKIIENPSFVLARSRQAHERVWVGTDRGLVSLVAENGKFKEEHTFEKINLELRTISEDPGGNLWLGTLTEGVLNVAWPRGIDNPVIKRYKAERGLPHGEVHVFEAAGHVMFATEKGIKRFDQGKKQFIPDYTLGKELADGSRSVFRITEDRDKQIWLFSGNRIIRAERQPGGLYRVDKKPFLRLPMRQVNSIYPEAATVWFGSIEGLIRYDSNCPKNYTHPFPALVRRVIINGKPLETLKYIFPFTQRNVHFEFAAPFFEFEEETRYRCFLEGNDSSWSAWEKKPKADYFNLDSGQYNFRVQAMNIYNDLSREDVFRFRILPPWFKTWWAYLIYLLLFSLFIYLVVRWRSRKLLKEKQDLEQIVQRRTKEIEEKNRQLEGQTLQLKNQSEKLREMDRVKSRFFANISHEFRTPLTLIAGPLEQMITKHREPDETTQLQLMLRNSHRLLNLINQLLDLSKFESGKMVLRAGRQNIIPFLKGILASFESLAVKKNLALIFSSAEECIDLYFDSEKLERVIANLLANAVKFTPVQGKITLGAAKEPGKTGAFPGGFLRILIADTGIGIPAEKLPYIFDRFYQVGGSDEHKYGGTGIGLALVEEIVKLHRGKITVHSKERKGTEFTILLPLGSGHLTVEEMTGAENFPGGHLYDTSSTIPALPTIPAVPLSVSGIYEDGARPGEEETLLAKKTGPETRGKNLILLVEDNPDVRRYIKSSLQPQYRVIEAGDGEEGIRKAKKIIPDLIVSDVMMPKVDGCELCRVLKEEIKTSHIPIILLTARASEESMVRGLETGADDYIIKPFNTGILLTRIKNLIDLRRHLQLKIQRQMLLQPEEIEVSSMDKAFIKELQDLIEKNLADPEFNVETLLKKLYMGRTSLYHKIMALTGESPNQFIRSYRLKRAAQLLQDNFGNVTEVAFAVGFSNTAYFTKCFKNKFQQLPKAFQYKKF
jgi:signal transduction histidine kinase/DNA-binding response OmpR family regulator/ligand-binding sensor domain-containing protein